MILKYSDKNKFGGETWHIKIGSLFHIFISETNQNSFLVELKEWLFVNYKVRKSYISNNNFEITVKNALDYLQEYLNTTGKYYWNDLQKNKLLNSINEFMSNYKNSTDKKKEELKIAGEIEQIFKEMFNPHLDNTNEQSQVAIDQDVFNSPDYWIAESFKAMEINDNSLARIYAEKAYQINSNNIDICLIFLKTLILKIKNSSLYQLKTNLAKAEIITKILEERRKNGELNEKQTLKLRELIFEKFDFFEYVEDKQYESDNDFFL